jgi:hypothetical protein
MLAGAALEKSPIKNEHVANPLTKEIVISSLPSVAESDASVIVVVATPLNPPSELDTVKLPLVDAGVKSAADTPTPDIVNGITAPFVTPVVVNVNVMELVSASPGVGVIL